MADEVLGEIGDEVIFENDFVRVWGLRLDPGERQPWHVHTLSYLVIPLTAGQNEMHWKDGRVVRTNEEVGQVLWREPGAPHELHNTSTWTYKNLLVEIKGTAKGTGA